MLDQIVVIPNVQAELLTKQIIKTEKMAENYKNLSIFIIYQLYERYN